MNYKYRDTLYAQYFSKHMNVNGIALLDLIKKESNYFKYDTLNYLPANREAKILDLGCGYGSFIHYLNGQGYKHTLGIDTSAEQVAAASSLKLNVKQADASTFLALQHAKWDCITAFDLIEHLTKDEIVSLLQLCFNALKPGGCIIVRTPNANAVPNAIYFNGEFTHETLLSEDSLKQVFMACGYEKIAVRACKYPTSNLKSFIQKALQACFVLHYSIIRFAFGYKTKKWIATGNLKAIAFKF